MSTLDGGGQNLMENSIVTNPPIANMQIVMVFKDVSFVMQISLHWFSLLKLKNT